MLNLKEAAAQNQTNSAQEGDVPNLPSNRPIKDGYYNFRITEAKFGPSSKGFPMITLSCEIYNPDVIVCPVDMKRYNVAGKKATKYISLKENALGAAGDFMELLGLKPELDIENPDTEQFVGKVFSTKVTAKTREARTQPTAEQLAIDPNAKGDILIDPETGKPEVYYGYEIDGFNCKKAFAPAPAF